MDDVTAFLDRVLQRVPSPASVRDYQFHHWGHGGRPTEEGCGFLAIPGLDPARVMARVMDVNHYVGNLDHVVICRAVPDPRYSGDRVRFYQKVDVPMLAAIHHELILSRLGQRSGFEVAAWTLLKAETEALSARDAARSDYNLGAWLAAPGVLGYALCSAPKRDDVGFLKFKALTAGADVAASKVVRANIEAMAKWAARS